MVSADKSRSETCIFKHLFPKRSISNTTEEQTTFTTYHIKKQEFMKVKTTKSYNQITRKLSLEFKTAPKYYWLFPMDSGTLLFFFPKPVRTITFFNYFVHLSIYTWKALHNYTYSVYKSSIIATTMTIRDTAKIWHPEPISDENMRGWLDGLKTSPWTCFHPYSSPRSLS